MNIDKEDFKELVNRLKKVVEDMERIVKDKDILLVPREEKKKDVFHT